MNNLPAWMRSPSTKSALNRNRRRQKRSRNATPSPPRSLRTRVQLTPNRLRAARAQQARVQAQLALRRMFGPNIAAKIMRSVN